MPLVVLPVVGERRFAHETYRHVGGARRR